MIYKKKARLLLIINGVLLTVALALVILVTCFVSAGGRLYPRGGDTLDLRGKELAPQAYDVLARKKPGCQILWDVPFQGKTVPSDTRELTVASLSAEDLQMLKYFPELARLNGTDCPDYQNLAAFRASRPQCNVLYNVPINGSSYGQDTNALVLTGLSQEDAQALKALPMLTSVQISGCTDYALLRQLQQENPQWNLSYTVSLGGQEHPWTTDAIQLADVTYEELAVALTGLPNLTSLEMTNPRAEADKLAALQQQYPSLTMDWKVELFGKVYTTDVTEVDISGNSVADCTQVEAVVACLPNLEKLIMSDCGIDNETMAAFRERQRSNYKVVWTVYLSSKTQCRTDALYFMPIQQGEYYFQEEHGYNLRYCEDIICLDLGHHPIKTIEFVQYMPHLKYLILAFTRVQDVSPIVHCQELVYLEVDWSEIKDFTPIAELKNLEDLGINQTSCDITPILQMTWLKNLICVSRSAATKELLREHLTQTNLMLESTAGWRQTENYYAQRDVLGMPYMKS